MSMFNRLGSGLVRGTLKLANRRLIVEGGRRQQIQQASCCECEVTVIKFKSTGWNRFRGISSKPSHEIDPRKLTEDEWLKKLSPEQYYICREKGTEEPFSGKYYMHKEEGVYTCVCCGTELFSSKAKYDSGTGWPSFNECVGSTNGDHETHTNILRRSDNTLGTVRTEVMCKRCDGHLGHVFNDGPAPTGLRYCINSAAMKFVPKKLA